MSGYKVERIPLDQLTPFPRKLREHDLGAIAVSLASFGQVKPIVVCDYGWTRAQAALDGVGEFET